MTCPLEDDITLEQASALIKEAGKGNVQHIMIQTFKDYHYYPLRNKGEHMQPKWQVCAILTRGRNPISPGAAPTLRQATHRVTSKLEHMLEEKP